MSVRCRFRNERTSARRSSSELSGRAVRKAPSARDSAPSVMASRRASSASGHPICYVVVGFGVKGTNDKESPMPAIHKPPIALNFDEFIAVDTWLFAREGTEPPTPEEIENAYKKFIPQSEWPKPAGAPGAAPAGPAPGALVATGDEPVNEIFIKALCFACHTIPGIQGAVGVVGPKLVERTNAPKRLKDPNYKGNATTVREYIMESILTPSKYVVPGFPDNVMPKDFGKKLNAAAINKVINYLSQLRRW